MRNITIDGIVFEQVECACQPTPREQCAMHQAAPELLEALKMALDALRAADPKGVGEWKRQESDIAYRLGNEAIARAEGRSDNATD